jgi:hypothetical protein
MHIAPFLPSAAFDNPSLAERGDRSWWRSTVRHHHYVQKLGFSAEE